MLFKNAALEMRRVLFIVVPLQMPLFFLTLQSEQPF